jgi:malyl-CoA/(S)-citramalyl-CoA lyase
MPSGGGAVIEIFVEQAHPLNAKRAPKSANVPCCRHGRPGLGHSILRDRRTRTILFVGLFSRSIRPTVRNPRKFLERLSAGAPAPLAELPVTPSRVIHFFDPSNVRMAAKLPQLAMRADVLAGNLEDGVPPERKEQAREALVRLAREADLGHAALWARINALDSPWALDDIVTLVGEARGRISVLMVPKVEGPWDIHYADRLIAQVEARAGLERPVLLHAVLETALGVVNVEEIAAASPRIAGMSLGPGDLAASRGMHTTRVGGGHPGYTVLADPGGSRRASSLQDPWHYTLSRMIDACAAAGIAPFYGPFGDIGDPAGCEAQFRSAFVMGCAGAWSLHPDQIEIARRVFSPDVDEVAHARRVLDALPDGSGTAVVDGAMQDDATWKQCRALVELARMVSESDPELAAAYGFAHA